MGYSNKVQKQQQELAKQKKEIKELEELSKKKNKRKGWNKSNINIIKHRQNNMTKILKVPIDEYYNITQIDHIDGNRENNNIDNGQIILTELHDIKSRDKSENQTFSII